MAAPAPTRKVLVAFLLRSAAPFLPRLLESLRRQDYPKELITLYFHPYNCTDQTAALVEEWVEKHNQEYDVIIQENTQYDPSINELAAGVFNTKLHQAEADALQRAAVAARDQDAALLVWGQNNFLQPEAISALMKTNLPVVAPFLQCTTSSEKGGTKWYSNYHAAVDVNGYCAEASSYYTLHRQEIRGLISVPAVKEVFLVRRDQVHTLRADDGTDRAVYVMTTSHWRSTGVEQYLDNRRVYGRVSLAKTPAEFEVEPWKGEFPEGVLDKDRPESPRED